ncbi:hypothetical protein JCM5353_002183 [Sporobolomyces roseus]
MDAMDLNDVHELSFHPASSSLSPAILLSFPPELLSHTLSFCSSDTYIETKATFARLCLVNQQFLPIAREHLYHELHLLAYVYPKGVDNCEANRRLLITLKRHERCAVLVRELFVHIPPDLSLRVGLSWLVPCLRHTRKVQKVWLLELQPSPRIYPIVQDETETVEKGEEEESQEEESGEWTDAEGSVDEEVEEEENEGGESSSESEDGGRDEEKEKEEERLDEEAISKVCTILSGRLRNVVKTIVLPQLPLQGENAYKLVTRIKNLSAFKGSFASPPPSTDSFSKSAIARLTRIWITSFDSPTTLNFVLSASAHSLRYLYLSLSPDNGSISLSHFSQLQHLSIHALLPVLHLPMPTVTGEIMLAEMIPKEPTFRLLSSIVETVKTTRELSHLNSYTYVTEKHQSAWIPSIEEQFSNLPPSIVEIAVGPADTASFLPSAIGNHISSLPALRSIRLVQLVSSCGDPTCKTHSPSDWRSAEIFKLEKSVQLVEVVMMSRRSWKVWELKQFSPEGKGKEIEPERDYTVLPQSVSAGEVCVVA